MPDRQRTLRLAVGLREVAEAASALGRPDAGALRRRCLLVLAAMCLAPSGMLLAQQQYDAPMPSESRGNHADRLFELWAAQLVNHVRQAGDGDPAVLAQLPLMRTPASPRPAQIVFSVTDLDALVPGRDGYDLTGALLDKRGATVGVDHVFVVAAVRRKDSRPVAIVDIRLVHLLAHDSALAWRVGAADADALARYQQHSNTGSGPRFPGALDRFEQLACGTNRCAQELRSGARWRLE